MNQIPAKRSGAGSPPINLNDFRYHSHFYAFVSLFAYNADTGLFD